MFFDSSLTNNSKYYGFFVSCTNEVVKELGQVYFVVNTIIKVKLTTVVEGDPKAPFSIAIKPRCRGGRYSFSWNAPLYVPYNAEC